jgi:excisionase family DNA binding protein
MTEKPKRGKVVNTDDILSVGEAAELRGVRRSAIHMLIARGRLPVLVIGGRTFLLRDDVLAFKPEKGGRGRKAAKVS